MAKHQQLSQVFKNGNVVTGGYNNNSLKPLWSGHWMRMEFDCNYFWDFFETDWWKMVTKRILKKKGYKCSYCKSYRAKMIITRSFDKKVLREGDPQYLFPCCNRCYKRKSKPKAKKKIEQKKKRQLVGKYYI